MLSGGEEIDYHMTSYTILTKLQLCIILGGTGLGLLTSCNNAPMNAHDSLSPSFENTLLSVEHNLRVDQWEISHQDLGIQTDTPWSVKKYTLKGGKQEGVEKIEVDNGALTISIIPTRGMAILAVDRGDVHLGWDSPVKESVHPQFMELEDNGGLGWLEGFNEWMTRCGLEFAGHPGRDNGRLLTLHGKIGNIPASEVQVHIDKEAPHTLRIRGLVKEVWFNGPNLELWTEVSTVPGSNSFTIEDVLTNKGTIDQEFMLIYHANFGPPILEQGSKLMGMTQKLVPFDAIALADVKAWDSYGPPVAGKPEQVYCHYPYGDASGNSHFLLQNAQGDKAVGFSFPVAQMPYLTQWKNENSGGYVTGLEPGTGFPHNRSVERKYGRVPVLSPGAQQAFRLTYTLYSGKGEVSTAIDTLSQMIEKPIEVLTSVIGK